ncbi:MAG: LacI family DNA-binding transcriptional regulator [Lutimaribacter sp.]|jgi:LacI family gluconate utilization system Gnt-I transcriptional repressor
MVDKAEMRPTMEDVAAAAGVSQMTVSRVMRGTGQTSDKVRKRVQDAARLLGYVPNRLATALRDETAPLIAVVLPTLGNRVFSEVLNGVQTTLAGSGVQPVFGVTEYSAEREEELVRDLLSWRPRGIILPGLEHSQATRATIRASGVRVAEVMDIDGDPISVAFGMSQIAAGRCTAQHMLSKGYRRFGYIGSQGGKDLRALKRLEGFRAAIREAGAQIVTQIIRPEPSSMTVGRRATAEVLAQAHPPQAIYYSNDDLAAGGIMHCLSEGIAIPSDVALAGFNGLPFLEALPVRLTTVETPRLQMGVQAALHLIGQETDQDGNQDRDPERHSTGRRVDLGFQLIDGDTC